jgi:hypothetical protein
VQPLRIFFSPISQKRMAPKMSRSVLKTAHIRLDLLKRGLAKRSQSQLRPQISSQRHRTQPEESLSFCEVDNPGNWLEYTFRPKFTKKDTGGTYTCHSLPTGAVPVPVNDGKQEACGWEFHYKGWKHDVVDNVSFRSGMLPENLFPENQQGCLDAVLLKTMGLTEARMANEDALFFYSFCFPCAILQNLESIGI